MKLKNFFPFALCGALLTAVLPATAQKISAGSQHSLFACTDSVPSSWGSNTTGQLGLTKTSYRTIPTRINYLKNVVAVSAGSNHSLFLTADGKVYASGFNQKGQLGDGTTTQKDSAIMLTGLPKIIAVSAGSGHSLFLDENGNVWASGDNSNGQLGDGTTDNKLTPVQITSLSGIKAISAGSAHSVFLKNDSTVYASGLNLFGLLGVGLPSSVSESTPVKYPDLSGITQIAAGQNYTLFLKADGTVMSVGNNDNGELGIGNETDQDTPQVINGLADVIFIEASTIGNSYFVKSDGTVWATGYNGTGAFGNNTKDNTNVPTQLSGLTDIVEVAAGTYHAIYLKKDGSAKAAGGNAQGQLGDQTSVNNIAMVDVKTLCTTLSTSLQENDFFQSNVKIYPNPANGLFTISSAKMFKNVTVTNMLGKTVYASDNDLVNNLVVDVRHEAAGIYFVRFSQDGVTYTGKVIVK